MKFFSVLGFLLILSNSSFGKTVGTKEQKMEFAKTALVRVLAIKGTEFTLAPDSIEITPCEGTLNKVGAVLSNLLASGAIECNTLTFYVYDKEGKIYSGKMLLTAEHKKRRNLGIKSEESMIPKLDLAYNEYTDEKTKKPFYLGIHSMSSQRPSDLSAIELFSIQKLNAEKPSSATKSGSGRR